MPDEQEAIAPVELEAAITPAAIETAPEPVADEPTDDNSELELELGGELPTEEEIETTEIEWDDGKKYVIPKALETGILKNKDYTTKTQEAAALRKALDEREAAIEERLKVTDEELDARADLRQIDKTLAEYAKLTPEDWAAHESMDFAGTQTAWRQYQLLKDRRSALEGTINKAESERTGKAEQGLATRIQETVEYAKKSIPGWKPDTIPKLVEFAQSLGVSEAAIKANWSPTFVEILHRAQIGDQLLKKQATAPKLPNPNPGKPLEKVGGSGSPAARGDLASMDMEAYIAARQKGVGGKPLR